MRVGRGAKLRRDSKLISSDGEWEKISVPFYDVDELVFDVLWLGEDCVLLSPPDARARLISSVQTLVDNHG
jgi:predicted DNA-binding transcriptional regulator YafY